ncbi:hypothetical protein M422DRAFT_66978 [Sphaerobolus stellatus SS14]|uniref:DUF605-domain-containing protein n=1 Tax=Sphaerobolus stellatus (strain SS14) TaxID=990650 RepID=A0A0C9W340_SPHS4|nr:hypothetical protein M422DRAFT_66978 [Sphaerobolus stellatus SS14]
MSALDDWTLPPIPLEIKHLTPYFQRAQELRTRDPVMAYWCAFYGLQAAISIKGLPVKEFIANVLPVLEQIKAGNVNNETITNDSAATTYVEKFALRVFNMADTEDRKGSASRATAKRFLASANFLEVVQIFRALTPEDSEKIRYAKWKAADIAKAFREGRKPTPGDARSVQSPTEASQLSPAYAPTTLELPVSPPSFALAQLPPDASPGAPTYDQLHTSEIEQENPQSNAPQASVGTESPRRIPPSHLPPPSTPPHHHTSSLGLGDGQDTPGTWSTVATPGVEYFQNGRAAEMGSPGSPSDRSHLNPKSEELDDGHDDSWSTAGNMASRQNSWTVGDTVPLPQQSPTNELGLHGDLDLTPATSTTPVVAKRVHFSPSVVGGLSSASNSVAASSPPGSPERYAPTLPTVDEAAYAAEYTQQPSASPRLYPLPESESSTSDAAGSPQTLPPVIIHKVTSPVSQNGALGHSPSIAYSAFPVEPSVPHLPPPSHHALAESPDLPTTRLPSAPSLPVGNSSPQLPSLHPTPYFAPKTFSSESSSSPASTSLEPPELTHAQMSQAQRHCRFAISALDFEDPDTARTELRKALALLEG